MTSVLLIYPYFRPGWDRSVFRFPPLGLAYLAATLQRAGVDVRILDCTFLRRGEAMAKALAAGAEVVGIYCMVTMLDDCLWFAERLRGHARLLVAGGPLPTCSPEGFLQHFDVVVRGAGEQAMLDLVRAYQGGSDAASLGGILGSEERGDGAHDTSGAALSGRTREIDALPFPARSLLPNDSYIRHGKRNYGFSITTLMSTRGCPFRCEFCSNVVFGGSYRERSAENVADEVEQVLGLGYERISFADDVFTLNSRRVIRLCDEIRTRGLTFSWECLGRVDAMEAATARAMRQAGCTRIYFGIESGDDRILGLMNKQITTEQARQAVEVAHAAGLEVGAFFILFYPGDTDETVLNTLRFASSLPLNYLGLTLPYPLPGTALYDRVKERITRSWRPGENLFATHSLIFESEFSETKMKFGLLKGRVQFELKRRLGGLGPLALACLERPSDSLLRLLR